MQNDVIKCKLMQADIIDYKLIDCKLICLLRKERDSNP